MVPQTKDAALSIVIIAVNFAITINLLMRAGIVISL
jgi:hypothetical protein